jgi:hypothetical protein
MSPQRSLRLREKTVVKPPALAGLWIKRKHAATVRFSRNQYNLLEKPVYLGVFASFAFNLDSAVDRYYF